MDNFPGSYSEDNKNKGISADSRQKTIENVKITIENSLILHRYSFLAYFLVDMGK